MKYVPQLDGVRCLAILGVMMAHWIAWEAENDFVKSFPWNHGVVLFFVLSGYLITTILLDQKDSIENGQTTTFRAIKNFYVRRTLRIFPLYYLTLFFLYYINYSNTRVIFPWLITYTSNIYEGVKGEFIGPFNHFWSLAVEEQFYLLWPSIILFIPKKHIMKCIFISILLAFVSRMVMVWLYPEKWMLASFFTLNLLFPLALGGLLAYFKKEHFSVYKRVFCHPVLTYTSGTLYVLLFIYVTWPFYRAGFDEFVFSLFAAAVVARASVSGFSFAGKWLLENPIVVYLGTISYGLYVFHLFMGDFYWNYLAHKLQIACNHKPTIWGFYFLACVMLASLSYHLLEKPINSLKRYFPYSAGE